MISKRLNGHDIVFYDSVEDLPVVQFHRYSKFLLVEGGIGDNINDIDRHISRILQFIRTDIKKATQEILNLRQCLYVVATEQDIHNKATLCLIKSVDGQDWTDFSDNGLDRLYEVVNGASLKELDEIAAKVRDAIDAMLQITAIVKEEDNSDKVEEVTQKILSMQNPKGFMGADSEEVRFDKQFEDMCLLMAKEFGGGIKKFTTMEFYTAFERLTRQYNEAKKLRNNRKR